MKSMKKTYYKTDQNNPQVKEYVEAMEKGIAMKTRKVSYGWYDGRPLFSLDEWVSMGLGFGVMGGMLVAIILRYWI